MIVGLYDDSKNQGTVELTCFRSSGSPETITAIVDTGFSGYLMLPQSWIGLLNPPFLQDREVVLADGTISRLNLYEVRLEWHGRTRTVPTFASQGDDPLVGMKLLKENLVTLELYSGGGVTIESV